MSFPQSEAAAKLKQACEQLPFSVSESQQAKLLAFLSLIYKWNKAYNLTSVRDPLAMVTVHLVDSVAVYPHLQGNRFIDVGTGPGLPGVPLAILCPEANFVLLDSLGKRIRFLKQVAFELKLANIEPIQSRVEQYSPSDFDAVITRAYASIEQMLSSCQHLVNKDGEFLALKGQYPSDELNSVPNGYTISGTAPINVPGLDAERHVIKIKKQ